jgi:hypothetical protein
VKFEKCIKNGFNGEDNEFEDYKGFERVPLKRKQKS